VGIVEGVIEEEFRCRKKKIKENFEPDLNTKKEAIKGAVTKEDEIKATNSFKAAFSRFKDRI
jgi:hypothetical protein